MKTTIKKQNIFLYIGLSLLLLLSFNVSLNPTFLRINGIYVCMITSLICMLFYGNKNGGLSFTTIKRSSVVLWGTLLLPIILNNQDVEKGRIVYLLYYLAVIIWGFFLERKCGWEQKAWRIIQTFCLLHFAAGLFFLANKGLLINRIVPLFNTNDSAYRLLISSIENGYMTGLCYHYSTMGMYMAIGAIAFSGVLFQNKKIKMRDLILFILFLIGLSMTGKRGPLLFTILSLGIAVLVTREKRFTRKQLQRGVAASLILIVSFIAAYINVPQLKQVIDRFAVSSGNLNDLSSGRIEYFWVYAIDMFLDSPIFGKGWRTFKYHGIGTLNANDAHNIYLQLLAEVGLVGFVLVLFFMIRALITTYKAIRENEVCLFLSDKSICILKMSFAYQIFFILYGFTGNPLYDPQCYYPYILCCSIGYSAANRIRNNRMLQNQE